MTKSIAAASAVALTLAASPALALGIPITFPDDYNASDDSFDNGMFSGSVEASTSGPSDCVPFEFFCLKDLGPTVVTSASDGLGVAQNDRDPDSDIDGSLFTETLTFSFDGVVDLYAVTFGDFDTDDDYSLKVTVGSTTTSLASEGTANPFFFGAAGLGASSFSVTANGLNDSFTVKEIGIVPLPGALPLIATGAAVFGWAARRKRAA